MQHTPADKPISVQERSHIAVARIAFVGIMAAMILVVSNLYIPFLGSKVHLGNTICILSGLLFGPVVGGLGAGIGSLIFDMIHGYAFWEALITFVSKFAMAMVAGLLIRLARHKRQLFRSVTVVIASVLGALTYTALYMCKHFVLRFWVEQVGWEATLGVLASKLPASLINALFAMICAPLLYHALYPALMRMGTYRKMDM